ncbi:MAG: penicillin-binding transpeptidase domain-containing protein, partial [Chloroflexota bacterium]
MRKRTKFALLRTSILLIFAILAGRVWYVQVVQGKYYKQQADTSKIRVIPVQAPRGIIYDSQGRQLVYNTPSWSVQIVPHGIPYRHASAIYHQLSRLLHGNPSAKAIASIVRSYSWRPYGPAPIKLGISSDTAMIIKQLHYALPGVQVQPSSIRQYVQDAQYSLTHILGYAGDIVPSVLSTYEKTYPAMHVDPTDQAGKTGVELSLDPYLHGINGRQRVEVDAGERPIHVIQPAHTIAGDSVTLTLNWKLQQQVSRDLATGLQHLGLQKGVAILENVRNGQILSMVSLPSYNNNLFSGRIPLKTYNALLHAPGLPLNDLATQGQFPPGSTYKLITATAALQTGVTNASRTIDD